VTSEDQATASTARRPGGRSARVREAVLAALVAELAQSGYGGLSLEAVARRAGVNKTTIYRRWRTREALIVDLMLARAEEVVPVPDTGTLRTDLIELARAAVANAGAPEMQAIIRAAMSEIPHEPRAAAAMGDFWRHRMALDTVIVERAIARGELADNVDPQQLIEALLAPLHLRMLIGGEPADEGAIERAVDFVLGAAA
jgi:AcrR family transcriptional regulator